MPDISYKGWVPTVLGNLSFKILGKSEYPFPFIGSDSIGKDNNSILILQKRITQDYQIPIPFLSQRTYLRLSSWLASTFNNENIESAFILQCSGEKDLETDSIQLLEGKVYRFFEANQKKQKELYSELETRISNNKSYRRRSNQA